MLHAPLDLRELQRAFHAPNSPVAEWIVGNHMDADTRLGIYRNNSVSNLCAALQADYPVVEKLVGREFFRHMAKTYIADTPSLSGDINDYGDDFTEFIADFPAAAALPYLADVARLEQSWKQCFYAGDEEAIDVAAFATLSTERMAELRFGLHSTVRLLSSTYPVMQLWSANQSDAEPESEINLDSGAEWIFLRRVDGQVQVSLLSQAEFTWLAALSGDSTLAEAVEAAFAVSDNFDLAPCLQRHLAQGAFAEYSL